MVGVGGPGVHGIAADVDGVGVEGTSSNGRGGVFQSTSVAQLQLRPRLIATPQGNIAGQMGDLFVTQTPRPLRPIYGSAMRVAAQ